MYWVRGSPLGARRVRVRRGLRVGAPVSTQKRREDEIREEHAELASMLCFVRIRLENHLANYPSRYLQETLDQVAPLAGRVSASAKRRFEETMAECVSLGKAGA